MPKRMSNHEVFTTTIFMSGGTRVKARGQKDGTMSNICIFILKLDTLREYQNTIFTNVFELFICHVIFM
jgi:hypothetical protein